ncbi:MAG: TonB family protein [Alistipes sp.]|nr:TonB family protein [Alistipes sp.]
MEYYDPIDRSSKRIAAMALVAVMAAWVAVMYLSSVEIAPRPEEPPLVLVEIVELPEQEPIEKKPRSAVRSSVEPDTRTSRNRAHETPSPKDSSAEAEGEAEKTQTINQQALFRPVTGTPEESVPTGNRLAPEGEQESHHGEGRGYNLSGSDQLDAGLQGRGLREALPRPRTDYNTSGKVVIYVTVDAGGNVTSAEFRQTGSTTNDRTLIDLALEAARKAKFNRSSKFTEGGTITYKFNLN